MNIEKWIPTVNVATLQAKVKQVNKKAQKFSLQPVELEILERGTAKLPILTYQDENEIWEERDRAATLIRISAEVVRISGWTAKAVFDFSLGDTPIIREMPDFAVPKKYHGTDNMCDHCGYRRNRRTTYLLEKDGELKRVGKTCLKDYLGYDPARIIRQVDYLTEILFIMGDPGRGYVGAGRKFVCELDMFLPVAAAIIRTIGWVSNSAAYEDPYKTSTSAWACDYITDRDTYRQYQPPLKITDKDKDLARKAQELAAGIPKEETDKNSYLYNLCTIAKYGIIGYKEMGYAASMISWYERCIKPEDITGNYIGTVGDPIEFTGTVEGIKAIDAHWGTSLLHRFKTEAGDTVIWFTSSIELEEGEQYHVKARIKAHNVFQDQKQTIITRARCKAVEGLSEA